MLTPTELRILQLLKDGGVHSLDSILERCIDDELASKANVRMHIARLRRKLKGERIECVTGHGYRLTVLQV